MKLLCLDERSDGGSCCCCSPDDLLHFTFRVNYFPIGVYLFSGPELKTTHPQDAMDRIKKGATRFVRAAIAINFFLCA